MEGDGLTSTAITIAAAGFARGICTATTSATRWQPLSDTCGECGMPERDSGSGTEHGGATVLQKTDDVYLTAEKRRRSSQDSGSATPTGQPWFIGFSLLKLTL